jgi:hypothetical protein
MTPDLRAQLLKAAEQLERTASMEDREHPKPDDYCQSAGGDGSRSLAALLRQAAAALVEPPASAGQTIDCPICRMQGIGPGGHWAWHRFCRAELNPIALYAFVKSPAFGEAGQKIAANIAALAGMDVAVVEKEIGTWKKK